MSRPTYAEWVSAFPFTNTIRLTGWVLLILSAVIYLARILLSPLAAPPVEPGGWGNWLMFVGLVAGVGEVANLGKRISYDPAKDPRTSPAVASAAAKVAAPIAAAVAQEVATAAVSAAPAPPPPGIDPNPNDAVGGIL